MLQEIDRERARNALYEMHDTKIDSYLDTMRCTVEKLSGSGVVNLRNRSGVR